jgi:hypothetical protein
LPATSSSLLYGAEKTSAGAAERCAVHVLKPTPDAGTWNSTAVLLEAGAAIEMTARKLPYVTGF